MEETGSYIVVRSTLTILLRSVKEHFFRYFNTSDQKLFWKTVHLLTSNSPSVPTLIHDTGKAVSGKEKAEVLSEFCFLGSVSLRQFLLLVLLILTLLVILPSSVQMTFCVLLKR